jgi:hypothetical protein
VTATLFAALVAAQADVDPVLKLGYDKHGKRDYARSEDMIAYGRTVLGKHGLALLPVGSEYRHLGEFGDKKKLHGVMRFRWKLVHVSGESQDIEREMIAAAHDGMALDKACAAADTYDLGYLLRSILQADRRLEGEIPVDERNDREREEPASTFNPRARVEERGQTASQGFNHSTRYGDPRMVDSAIGPVKIAPIVVEDASVKVSVDLNNAATEAQLDAIFDLHKDLQWDDEAFALIAYAYRARKIDFATTPEQFARCAAKIQQNFKGQDRERLMERYELRKASVSAPQDEKGIPY